MKQCNFNISAFSDEELRRVAEVLKAIAHPVRLRLLCSLKCGEMSVRELEETLDKPQALVSQQLRILRLNGLVESSRRNGFAFYHLLPDKKQILETVMGGLCDLIGKKFDNDKGGDDE